MSYVRDAASVIRELIPEQLVPEHADSLFLVYAVLALTKGEAVTGEDVHHAWTAWMDLKGEDHPSKIPYGQLDPQVRTEDQPFVDAIRTAARRYQTS